MAADFSQDAVLHFLQSRGGSVKNADLLLHFRAFLRDHADRDRNRELFKKFVNSVATVKQEDGVSHVVLRRRFRGSVPGGGAGPCGLQAPKNAPSSADNGSRRPAWSTEKPRAEAPHWRQDAGPGPLREKPVLPAAGILLNHNNSNNNNLDHHRVHIGPGPEPRPEPEVSRESNLNLDHHRVHIGPGPEPRPEPEVSRESNQNLDHHRVHIGPEPRPEPEVYTQTPHANQSRPGPGLLLAQQQVPESVSEKGCGLQLEEEPPLSHIAPRRLRHRKSYKSAVSVDDVDDDEEEEEEEESPRRPGSVGGAWPLCSPLLHTARVFSSSSPCIMEAPPSSSSSSSSSHRGLPQIFIQDVDQGRDLTEDPTVCHRLPLEAELCGAAQTPSSHGSIFSPSNSERRPSASGGWAWSSCDDLQTGETGGGAMHTGRGGPLSALKTQWCQSADLHDDQETSTPLVAFHRSMGDLYDKEAEESDGSASSSAALQHPAAARSLSSKLRSRMCRSLGADLDQLLQEEDARRGGGAGGSEAARLNRLHLISSSLSLRHNLSSSSLSSCSTPPRCLSFPDLVEGTARRRRSLPDSTAALDGSTRPSQVPLESREHVWLVKAAAGAWPEIYSLFREDSSLLNRRDFISGFTVLHWIAKHGDHRVLNTLWYGVEKAGLTFDINAQSSCGHTPLHIAAIHNHKNIIRLLVNKFSADLRRRDVAGKRAWQYLGRTAAPDLFQLLGAPPRVGQGLQGAGQRWEPQQPQRRRRHRRHHFSSAGEKPLNLTKVKRSSSIAAFLKHKSIQRLTARPRSEAFL